MMDKNIEVLEEVLDVLEDEKKKFYGMIDENDFKIEKITSYLRELSKMEDDDFRVFSPRSTEKIHREQIAADTSEREKYEAENVEYQKKIEFLKNLIDKVNVVIENLRIEKEKTKPQMISEITEISDGGVEKNSVAEDNNINNTEREHISHQILNCISFIVPDAERAKVELTAIAEKIRKGI